LTNTNLNKLRTAARHVAATFDECSAISAILVHGSVALERVDGFSDVDMLIICRSEILPLSERRNVLSRIGSDWYFDEKNEDSIFAVVDRDGLVDGVLVSVHYQTVPWIEDVLGEILKRGAISTEKLFFRPYTLPALIQRAWVLRDGDSYVERWREMSGEYPVLLRENILRHFVPNLREHLDELKRTAERGLGARNFIFFLNQAVDDLTSILFALNKVYDPADRRMDTEIVPFLPYLPKDYVATITEVLEGPFDQCGVLHRARLFERLAVEVLCRADSILREAKS
jgi:predicted nucleotidyltransferase